MRFGSHLVLAGIAASWCVIGCRPERPPSDDDTGELPARVCDDLAEGTWKVSGPPFGMPMDVTVRFEAERCRFTMFNYTFNGAPMSHSEEMWGGVIDDGDQVFAFGSSPFWDSCTGTLYDGKRIEGDCADAAEGRGWFELSLKE